MINVQTFFFTHIASELEYGLHGVGVATRELALDDWAEQMCKPRQMFEGTKKNAHTQESEKYHKKIIDFNLFLYGIHHSLKLCLIQNS